MKKFLLIVGFLALFTISTFAQTATAPTTGDGSSGSPYEIATIENLYWLTQNSAEWGNHFVQTADIDASASSAWDSGAGFTPIGNSSTNFTGQYDGDNHTISGIYIDRNITDRIGLFGNTNGATVTNLNLSNVDITGAEDTGGLVGYNVNSSISDITVSGNVKGTISTGGVAGNTYSGTITNSQNSASVTGTNNTGGLAGFIRSSATVSQSYSTGLVDGWDKTGGLVGYNEGSTVSLSYSTGTVSGDSYTGGLVGSGGSFATIENSYSTGGVSGTDRVGGLAGWNNFTSVSYCYSTGLVNGTGDTGGLIGYRSGSSSVTSGFWNTESSGHSSSDGGSGLTISQMKHEASFTGFDFSSVWSISEDFTFPWLQGTSIHRSGGPEIEGTAGWRMLSSSIDDNSYADLLESLWIQGFTGADDEGGTSNVLTRDESGQQFVSISDAANNPGSGSGFIVYVYDDVDNDGSSDGFPKSILTEGEVDTTSVSVSVSYTDTGSPSEDGWNLVGNPYVETIDWDASGWTRTNLSNTFYIWDNSSSNYLTWNGSSGTLSDGKIVPFQGFWVQADGSSPALEMTANVKSSGGSFYKSGPVNDIKLKLEHETGLLSQAVIMFDENAQTGKDRLDAWKLQPLSNPYLSLYSTDTQQHALDINTLPTDLENSLELGIDFRGSNLGGKYTLSWDPNILLESIQNVSLKVTDVKTGRVFSLNKSGEYNFSVEGINEKSKITSMDQEAIPDLLQHGPVPTVHKAKTTNPRFVLSVNPNGGENNFTGIPEETELVQNYPNPFNPETVIRYGVPEQQMVSLSVFDVLGRRVATLVEEQKSAGRYEVNFDASQYSSGLYIYQLKVGANVLTKKMMLIK